MGPALFLLAAATACGAPEQDPPATADAPAFTISVTGDYSNIPDSDAEGDLDSASGGLGMSWSSGGITFGGSLSRLEGSALPPEFAATSDGSGLVGSLFVGWSAGDYDLDLSVSHAQQTLEGTSRIADDGPPALAGREVTVDGESRSWSASFGVARSFHQDAGWLRPHASLAWNQTETEASAALVGGGGGLQSNGEASGVSLAAGVEAGTYLSDWLSVFVDVTGVTSSNEAANVFGWGGRATARPTTSGSDPDDEGGAWADLSAGFAIDAPGGVSLSLVAGASAGRQEDDVFASMSLSKTF
jgi:hypothetical protein